MTKPILKFCGNRSLADYELAVKSGADYIGLVFYKKSKRAVTPGQVSNWMKEIAKGKKQLVGVFVNPTFDEVELVLDHIPLDVIQCHGTESAEWLFRLRRMTKVKIWKAIHHSPTALDTMCMYQGVVDGYIVDCKTEAEWGGTGQSFDWEAIPDYQKEAHRQGVTCLIAGGISPKNIDRLLTYHPNGIDIASGIEENGKKSAHLIKALERKVGVNNESIS